MDEIRVELMAETKESDLVATLEFQQAKLMVEKSEMQKVDVWADHLGNEMAA
jgi:hypothetical protein